MNAIQALSAHPGVERLGAALLHFLWEGVLIAAVYAAARRAARTSAASVRYLLACGALASMAAAVVLTWSMPAPAAPARVAAALPPPASMAASGAVQNISLMFLGGVNRAAPASLLPWVVAVWLAGATALWLRLLGGWILTERLRFRLALPAPREWQRALDRLATRVRVSRPARLLVSALVDAPGVVGWLRPVVLVPAGALTGLPPEQVEALLLHELAHIRRHDYLVNILQSAVEALLFHHPAVWWISGHIRAERELCCDDATVRVTGDAITYARALAGLGPARFGTAMAASGGPLAQRIARLLGQSRPAARTLSGPGIVAAALLLAAAAFAVFGQPADRPRFEVASVKPAADRGGSSVRPLPGRLTTDAPLRLIMENAYAVQSFQVVGGPDWVDSEHYAIEAKAAGNPSHAQIFLMLQALLEDRFQLKI
ncbi:MAG TPA: M56 family metallopeptidase, partial [Candidatus Sulfopaludibacter sp.]|nr:M56 family metallopeptidase [Candidatus Sulfopaludibacter sp.]